MDEIKEAGIRLTPTEQRIMAVLIDGEPHVYAELIEKAMGEGEVNHLRVLVHSLNKKLHAVGQDIACIAQGGRRSNAYRLVWSHPLRFKPARREYEYDCGPHSVP